MQDLIKKFRDPAKVKALLEKIQQFEGPPVSLMEVCGTHTMAIFRYGIKGVLPSWIRLLSGPGCPVCVTSYRAIDTAIEMACRPGVIFTTFGDMIRVPGSSTGLSGAKAQGADVRVIYSPLEAVNLARKNPAKEIIFFAIGFETTAPVIAAAVLNAREQGLENFSILGTNKTIPQALKVLLTGSDVKVDGLICPGHVSTIIGSNPYEFIPRELGIPAVITGFEPVDILQGIYLLLGQIKRNAPRVEIQYRRGVTKEGNPHALEMIDQVFETVDDYWRGLGIIPGSGLKLKEEYSYFDAARKFPVEVPEVKEPAGCRCGEVLRGAMIPLECPLFGKMCTPERPVGACMVSLEGTCAAYYKYGM